MKIDKRKMASSHKQQSSNKNQFLRVCKLAGCFFPLGTSFVILPYLSAPVQHYFYLSNLQRTWLPIVFFLFCAITSPMFGHLSDVYGRAKLLQLTYSMETFVGLCASFAPSYSWFVFLFALCGAFRPPPSIVLSLSNELTSEENKHWTAILPASGAFSSFVVGFLPLLIDPNRYWRFTFFNLMFMPYAVATLMLFKLEEPSNPLESKKGGKESKEKIIYEMKNNSARSDVTLSESLKALYHEFFFEFSLIIIMGFLSGVISGPIYNMASEFSHYIERACIKASGSNFVSLKCSDLKILSSSDIFSTLLAPLCSGIITSLIPILAKYIKLGTLIRVFSVLQTFWTILLYMYACNEGRIRVAIICLVAGIYTTSYCHIQLYTCEIFPRTCRGFASSVLVFFSLVGDSTGFFLIENTMYEHFMEVLVFPMVTCVTQTVISFFLKKSRNQDLT